MRCWLLIWIVVAGLPARTVLLHESFDGAWSTVSPPGGWRIVWEEDTASNDWHRAPDLGKNPWSDNGTPYALLDSAPLENGLDSLISPAVNCTDFNVVQLRCSTFFRGLIGPYQATLVGSVDNGPFDRLIFDYSGTAIGPELQTFDLAWAANQPRVRVAWAFQGASQMVPYWCVDNVTIIGEVNLADVGCAAILSPPESVDSLATVVPVAVVRNYGTVTASFPVVMEIGIFYRDTVLVENLPGGAEDTVRFDTWQAGRRGITDVVCYTDLPGDVNPANDRLDRQTSVTVFDVAALAVLQPADTLDSAAVVQPAARVLNCGQDYATFWVYMRIGTWRDSALVDSLGPDETRDVRFGSWQANLAGPGAAVCSTGWTLDRYPSDDTTRGRFFVRGLSYRDAGAEAVLAPAGTVLESSSVTPRGVVRNHGAMLITVRVLFRMLRGDTVVYAESINHPLPPYRCDTVSFPAWLAVPRDSFIAELRLRLSGDMNPENDSVRGRFRVLPPFHDVGCTRISAPRDTAVAGSVVPSAWVRNYGNFFETFHTRFRITRQGVPVYQDSAMVAIVAPGESVRVSFPPWMAERGTYIARCSTALDGDADPANDLRMVPFWVESLAIEPGWHEMDSVRRQPSGKPVAAGGGLALVPDGRIFALKGNKTNDFYVYSRPGDSWHALRPVPPEMASDKPCGKGASICTDGVDYLYAIKGNNTFGFCRYDIRRDSWVARAPVPPGGSGKKVKAGSKTVYVVKRDTGWVYLLKGYKNEFWRYNVIADRWDTLPAAPLGSSGKPNYKEGSFIVGDGEFAIYCVKAVYNELFRFDLRGDTWETQRLAGYPLAGLTGKSKKVKDGGSGCWYDGRLFTLKGGNTQEFWAYTAATDSWQELDTIPSVGRLGRKKRVKAGGAIVAAGRTVFYALKGNKCGEFWRYRIPPAGPGIGEAAAGGIATAQANQTIVRGVLHLPADRPRAALLDLTGRRVMFLQPGFNDVSRLAPGVYFLRPVAGVRAGMGRVIIP